MYSLVVHELLRLSSEVASALREHRPVVALESTLITFGLPWPANADTALEMERIVRECGAVPATIAVLGGQIRVGLSPDQIHDLARRQPGSVRKCSTRDLPIAVGRGEDASTTVAATMIVAHKAGLEVFATGGIGGVHRGAPHDVSADLIELGRTPVAVVCAGAKAILDLPFTLEVLETQGVPIVGLGTDTLPGFYSRSSGLPIDTRVETPREAAAVVAASRRLGLERAVVIAVPVPEEHEFAGAEAAIAEATTEVERLGIRGKDVTPFLLKRVSELTGGAAQSANSALLLNSARAAALVARELTAMRSESGSDR
jgi:pseudouridine-5'-phosphate glycosidase